MRKQVSLKLLMIIVIILIIVFCGILLYITRSNSIRVNNTEYDIIDIQYGDVMEGFKVKDVYGNSYDKLPVSSTPTIVFYLSNTCSACADVLADFERIEGILGSKYISYRFLWYDKIPNKLIEKYKINKNWCYLVENNIRFTVATPTFYLLANDNKVEYYNSDASLVIDKLMTNDNFLLSKEELVSNANKYILSKYFENSKKEKCIYFTMEFCHECEEANQLIESDEVKEIYDVIKISDYTNAEDSTIKDTYGIFRNIYDITSYPSFMILNDDGVKISNKIPLPK